MDEWKASSWSARRGEGGGAIRRVDTEKRYPGGKVYIGRGNGGRVRTMEGEPRAGARRAQPCTPLLVTVRARYTVRARGKSGRTDAAPGAASGAITGGARAAGRRAGDGVDVSCEFRAARVRAARAGCEPQLTSPGRAALRAEGAYSGGGGGAPPVAHAWTVAVTFNAGFRPPRPFHRPPDRQRPVTSLTTCQSSHAPATQIHR